jgi:hypothetical protein
MTELRKVTRLAWRKFLASEYGSEGMLHLRESTPSIPSGDSHQIIFNAGRVEGYKQALDHISQILAVQEQVEQRLENE